MKSSDNNRVTLKSHTKIEDLPAVGNDLSEEHLLLVSGGLLMTEPHLCTTYAATYVNGQCQSDPVDCGPNPITR